VEVTSNQLSTPGGALGPLGDPQSYALGPLGDPQSYALGPLGDPQSYALGPLGDPQSSNRICKTSLAVDSTFQARCRCFFSSLSSGGCRSPFAAGLEQPGLGPSASASWRSGF